MMLEENNIKAVWGTLCLSWKLNNKKELAIKKKMQEKAWWSKQVKSDLQTSETDCC